MDEQTARVWIAAIGVVGTLAGAIVGALVTYRIERARRRHENETRFLAERKDLYRRFMAEADAVERAATVIAKLALGEGDDLPDVSDRDLARLQRAVDLGESTYSELTMMAPEATLRPATDLIMWTSGLGSWLDPEHVGRYDSMEDWRANVNTWREHRNAFRKAVRAELGVEVL